MTTLELIEAGQSEAGAHRIADILRCPRRYALRHKFPEPPSPSTSFGLLAHVGLSHLYARRMPGGADQWLPPEEAIRAAAVRFADEMPSPLWAEQLPIALRMPAAYIARYGLEPKWEVLGVEEELRVRIKDPLRDTSYLYTQRLDLRVRHRDTNKIYILDHKKAYAIIPAVTKRYTLAGQVAGYRLLGRVHYGEQFGGVLLNFIRPPSKEGEAFEFKRPRLEEAPAAAGSWKHTIIHAERLLAHLRETYGHEDEVDPMSWPGVFVEGPPCLGPYAGDCVYRDRCRGVTC